MVYILYIVDLFWFIQTFFLYLFIKSSIIFYMDFNFLTYNIPTYVLLMGTI